MTVDFGNPYRVLNDVWDQTARALRTTASLTLDSAGIATSTNQTDGSQKTQIVDSGGEAVTVTGGKLDVNASVDTTGLATSAKQDTIIGHLDGVEGLLTTIDADTGNVSIKIDTIAGAVSGTEMQVDVVTSALPTGASTLAEQQSQTTYLATIAGDTTAIETAVS